MPSSPNFIILIDALRHDDTEGENTPFLFDLKKGGTGATVIETCAFQTRPAFFAGLEPEVSNVCHLFEYDPKMSPFKFLRLWGPMARLAERISRRVTHSIIRRIGRRIERARGFSASARVLDTCRIPLPLLPYFAASERCFTDDAGVFPGHPTLFDLLRASRKTWTWIGYPRHYGSIKAVLKEYSAAPPADVAYLHFSELDWLGHRYGPQSVQGKTFLRELDGVLRKLLTPALDAGKASVVFGDHGMVAIERTIDIEQALSKLSLRLGYDYVYFLDSTQARFWFHSSESEAAISAMLANFKEGHILEAEERKTLGLNFCDNRFGDIIFAVNGGVLIHPSFFARGEETPKGMHGYLPDVLDNRTQVVAAGAGIAQRQLGLIPMTKIFTLLREALLTSENLPKA